MMYGNRSSFNNYLNNVKQQQHGVALGGLVVSVLATGPKVAGSNPAEDNGF
jgi:hypothetical protein